MRAEIRFEVSLEREDYAIPADWRDEATWLLQVSWKGRLITGLNQAAYHSYVYPVLPRRQKAADVWA